MKYLFLDIDGVFNSRDSLSKELLKGASKKRYDIHPEQEAKLDLLERLTLENRDLALSTPPSE